MLLLQKMGGIVSFQTSPMADSLGMSAATEHGINSLAHRWRNLAIKSLIKGIKVLT
jgi:hypothetical protein